MAIIKCNYCGGETEIDISEEKKIGVCKCCESMLIIPKQLGRKGNLYNRAVFLRQNNEFDQAESIYEDILREDNTDAEAHWGLALSKYGIEYVEDPLTQERIPTCHRMLLQTILADHDYQAALKEADEESRLIMEREGERIDQIQRRILEISRQEKPYDVFICYKETDEVGNRTEDSVLAQEIYQELEKKAYRVFFARKTLENKLGVEFEPIIYAALSSASVMIAVGTKPEHFKAVWVRNEWSRFLKMSKEKSKTLIPVYRGMSPYELPAELASFQGQDMGKIGGMQDLLDGVDRCMRHKRAGVDLDEGTLSTATGANRLIEKGEICLKLKNYEDAEKNYDRATREYPEDYRGWWGKIVCYTRNFTQMMRNQTQLDRWFDYVHGLTDEETLQHLAEQYAEYIRKEATLDAVAEVEDVKIKIEKDKEERNLLISKKESLRQEILEWKRTAEKGRDYTRENLVSAMKAKEELTTIRIKKKVCLIIGILALLIYLGSLTIFNDYVNLFAIEHRTMFCWCLGFLVFAIMLGYQKGIYRSGEKTKIKILLPYPPLKTLNSEIKKFQNAILESEKDLEESKEYASERILSIENQINKVTSQIEELAAWIEKKQKYIAIGEEKLAEYWFVSRCAGAGMNLECDPQLLEYREEVYREKK